MDIASIFLITLSTLGPPSMLQYDDCDEFSKLDYSRKGSILNLDNSFMAKNHVASQRQITIYS